MYDFFGTSFLFNLMPPFLPASALPSANQTMTAKTRFCHLWQSPKNDSANFSRSFLDDSKKANAAL
jgi:hypothetical protein